MRASTHRHASAQGAPRASPPTHFNSKEVLEPVFAGSFGGFLGLSLLKFGNPPIMEKWVTTPANVYECMYAYPWPIAWAWYLLGLVAVIGLFSAKWKPSTPRWLLSLPLIWFGWQCVAATQTVDAELTRATLKHFAACVVCFYLGLFSLSHTKHFGTFFAGLFCGFVLVLAVGIDQRFGGLDEYRRVFLERLYLYHQSSPPEFLKKISSNRIFSTLFYPNVLAGALLLLFPVMLREVHEWSERLKTSPKWLVITQLIIMGTGALWLYLSNSKVGVGWVLVFGLSGLASAPKWFLAVILGIATLATLFWSGSKGGWLIMLFLGFLALLKLPLGKKFKLILAIGVLSAGLSGFFWKYSGFFQKGATSVSARFDYWRAAIQTAGTHPLFGTGPGTFYIPYTAIKRPESEPSRLVHNDYLEQASDSGLVGLLAYSVFIAGGLIWTFKKNIRLETTSHPPGINAIELRLLSKQPAVSSPSPMPVPRKSGLEERAGERRPFNAARANSMVIPSGTKRQDWLRFSVWLGLLGWALQSLLEFGLYIPALAWPAFAFLGWLVGSTNDDQANRIDSLSATN